MLKIRSMSINCPRWCISAFLHREDRDRSGFMRADSPPGRHGHLFGQETVLHAFHPATPSLARGAKEFEDLLFASRRLFFRGQFLHKRWKVKSHHRGAVFLRVDFVLKIVDKTEAIWDNSSATLRVSGRRSKAIFTPGMSWAIAMVFLRTVRKLAASSLPP